MLLCKWYFSLYEVFLSNDSQNLLFSYLLFECIGKAEMGGGCLGVHMVLFALVLVLA